MNDRLMARVTRDDAKHLPIVYRALQLLLCFEYIAEQWILVMDEREGAVLPWNLELVLAPLAFFAVWHPLSRAAGLWVMAGIQFARVVVGLPGTANSTFLQAFCFLLFAMFPHPDRPGDLRWGLGSVRLLFIIITIQAGIQKVLHGYYFQGEALAVLIARKPHFAEFFGLFLPAAEIERLVSIPLEEGGGPFRLTSGVGIFISNSVWVSEIVLPGFLLFRRTVWPAMIGLTGTFIAIEAGAREFTFGILYMILLASFAPRRLIVPLAPLFVAGCLALLLIKYCYPDALIL